MKDLFSIRKLPFWTLVLLIIILSAATFVEKFEGSEYAYDAIYGSWWFVAVWAIVVGLSIFGIVKGKMYKNIPLLLVHISFIVILAGALCTKLTAQQGHMILQKGVPNSQLQSDKETLTLPFEVRLDSFAIVNYQGTNAAADYVSDITVIDKNQTVNVISGRVSMNNIFSYNGYRFYQTSFEDDLQTSILSVNKDVWGISITYFGYVLFVISMIWFIVSPQNVFRKLLANPLLKRAAVLLLLLFSTSAYSQTTPITPDGLTVSREQADQFGELWMLNDGRITPIATFAQDFTLKLTGKTSFNYLNSNQFLMAFLFFPDKWEQVALFKVDDQELKVLLNAEVHRASLQDFFDNEGNYKLAPFLNNVLESGAKKSAKQKEVEKLNDKVQLINMLHTGTPLQIYPQVVGNELKWFYPTQNLRTDEEQANLDVIRNSLLNYYKALTTNEESNATSMLKAIADFQQKNGGDYLPSQNHKKIELIYLKIDFASILFMFNLTLGLLTLLAVFLLPQKYRRKTNIVAFILFIFSFLFLTLSIAARTYIAGRLPFSNGYETMLVIAWSAMFIALIFNHKILFAIPFGFLISGCSLLVAHIGMMNPAITPLVPVLSSPLLSIHVSVIMLSYTLLAFVALNSIISLFQVLFLKERDKANIVELLEKNKLYSQLCLYPAILLLGAGIFIGAVWANISWGRYWGWDPKEVWALITFLIYCMIFHEKNLGWFKNPFFFHAFGLLSFTSVLMTYFGVNYFLGGMHSYAGQIQFDYTFVIIILSILFTFLLLFIGYKRYKHLII